MFNADQPQDNTGPHLVITKQTSVSEERVTKRGKTTNVFVVVKNSPFQLGIGLRNALANFNFLAFDMSLWYDMPGFAKEVAYVSTKPIDLKSSINDVGDEISFDVKIKVLSSHHEDNHFRLRVLVWDPSNPQFPQLTVFSHAIKVISKPMNQRKPRGTKRSASQANLKGQSLDDMDLPPNPVGSAGPTPMPLPIPPSILMSEGGPTMVESCLAKLDSQQQEGLRMLSELLNQQAQLQAQLQEALHPHSHQHAFTHLPPQKRMKLANSESGMLLPDTNAPSSSATSTTTTGNPLAASLSSSSSSGTGSIVGSAAGEGGKSDFEGGFSSMLRSYAQMNAEEKAERVRKVLRSLSQRDVEQLEELFDIMSTIGMKTSGGIMGSFIGLGGGANTGTGVTDFHSDACGEDCPHKMELSNIYQFYSEAFL